MINLAAAAVLVRDLTEQHLDGSTGSAPAGRNRRVPPNGSARAEESRSAPSGPRAEPVLSRPGHGRRRIARSA
jgi:hypothetical protein